MPHIAIDISYKVQFVIIVLVRPNCRWDPFAFLFVQGVVNNGPVVKGSLARIFIGVYHGEFAPRDSLRASAETMVCWALIMQFCNSRVSTRSEFQTMLLSETFRSSIWFQIPFIFSTPFFKTVPVLKTAACCCMVFCIANLRVAVGVLPLLYLSLSMLATEASPALSDNSLTASPGLLSSAMVLAQARPKTTKSKRELAP